MKLNEIDVNSLSPMMKEYVKTKNEYSDMLLFYRLGDFYEMFFEDAITASHALEITLTGKNAGLKERVPMCGVPHHAVDIYVNKLLDMGYKVAICEQMEDPKTAKGIVKREVTQILSKGTITNTDSLNEKDFNFIASITDYKNTYALSYADLLSGKVYTTFISYDNTKLISYLVNLNIKEVVVNTEFDKNIIYELKNSYGIYVSYLDDIKDIENNNIFDNIDDKKLINNTKMVLSYLENNQKRSLSHFQNVILLNKNDYLYLDKECIRNLELIETLRTKDRMYSLLWFLDKTKTAMGSRLLKSYIVNPLLNKEEIIKRQNLVELLIKEFLLKSELKEFLYQIYDLERLCGKVAVGNANARDLLQLKQSIKVIPDINTILEDLKLEKLETFDNLVELLDSSIDEDAPITIKEGNVIKDGYSSELDELKSIRKNGKDFISKFEAEEKERTGIKNLRIGYNKVFGYYIEISKGQASLIKEEFGYERKQTISNCERFINPLLKEKENLILNAEDKINSLEYDLFIDIKQKVSNYISELQKVSNELAFYDVMQSFATVAEENNLIKSIINEDNIIDIKEGRHPVVEKVIKNEYVSNDISMLNDENVLIITGPNMSGKSTFMRQLGVIVVMNQIGSFVPASYASLPIFDAIYTRIGATDDLVGGESTFMVEMKESANAIINATKNSLILFDELGRGTSTYDGMALAGSIIDYINAHVKCKTLFSTHYHELTKMSDLNEGIKNVHVSIYESDGDIKFLHKVKEGPVDKSYGINVAKLASLPKEVISKASELLNIFEKDSMKKKQVKQFSLDLEETNNVLKNYIDNINVLEITPLEALNILDEIKKLNN